jgi:hypothetical protein
MEELTGVLFGATQAFQEVILTLFLIKFSSDVSRGQSYSFFVTKTLQRESTGCDERYSKYC